MLAHIHEKLQDLMYLTGGMWSGDGDNPVAPVYRVPRPNEMYAPIKDDDASEDIGELNAQFGG